MSKPLTALKLKNTRAPAKPVGSRKAFKRLYDSGGLYFEITSNDERWWRLSYPYQGKRKLMSLGVYPTVSLAAARERRDDARRLLARGLDPLAQRQAHKRAAMVRSANSFEAVAREWHGRQAKVWTPKHADDVMRRLEANLFPDLGARPIAEIMAPDLLATARKVEARGAHDLAHRMLGFAGQVFRYGVATGRCERDPSGDLRGALTPHERHNQHAIRPEELPALLKAIDGYTAIGGERQTMLALRLLCLTFVRTNELIGAEWSEVNGLDGATPTWEVPAERMKMGEAHVVPLSRQAVAILKELREMTVDSRYVLPKPVSTIEQGKLDVGAAAPQSAPAATTTPSTIAKRPWPSELPTQIKAVADTLAMAGQPATIEVIGSWFSGKGPWRKRLPVILQSLEAMGRVRRLDDGRWGVSMPT